MHTVRCRELTMIIVCLEASSHVHDKCRDQKTPADCLLGLLTGLWLT